MKINITKLLLTFTLVMTAGLIFYPALVSYAQDPPPPAGSVIKQGVVDTGVAAGLGTTETNLQTVIARIIYYLLGFLGILFTILIMWGGFIWMTAGGNEQKVEQARKILTNSGIGLLIVIVAYAFTKFVFNVIIESIQTWW